MKVLFVDDEAQVLRGLERMLTACDCEWDMDFVSGGEQALERLGSEPFDVLVSDMRMPGMDGADLLEAVSRQHPQTVRIVLSGQASKSSVLRAINPMHQYLSKPCDADLLRATVSRACKLRDLLQSPELNRIVGSISSLPSVPSLYNDVLSETESPDGCAAAVGEIISKDPGMTAKILQITNSAAFGVGRPITSSVQAVSLLGMDTIKSLVLSVGCFQQFDTSNAAGFSIEEFFRHSTKVGSLARRIAKQQQCDDEASAEALTSGMLHDVGTLILAAAASEGHSAVDELVHSDSSGECSEGILSIQGSVPAIGAYLLGVWGLPQAIVEAIAFHRNPPCESAVCFSPVTAVAAADYVVHLMDGTLDSDQEQNIRDYLKKLELEEQLTVWQTLCEQEDCNE